MPKLIICRGLPASGKTFWAKNEVKNSSDKLKRVNKDDLRQLMDLGKYSKKNEILICKVRDLIVSECLNSGYNIVSDDTNLKQIHINDLTNAAKGFDIEYKTFFHVPLELILKRDREREGEVGEAIIRRSLGKYWELFL